MWFFNAGTKVNHCFPVTLLVQKHAPSVPGRLRPRPLCECVEEPLAVADEIMRRLGPRLMVEPGADLSVELVDVLVRVADT